MIRKFFALAVSAAASCGAALAGPFSIDFITAPSATSTQFWDINDAGTVVGNTDTDAFTYAGGSFTTLTGPAGASGMSALGISDAGTVVGSFADAGTGTTRGYIYDGSTYETFDIPGADETRLRGISPDGNIVTGYYTDASNLAQGFILDRTTNVVTLIGAGGLVVNPGEAFTIAQGVNSSGVVVGSDLIVTPTFALDRPAFTFDIGTSTRTDFNLPGALRTAGRGINDFGSIAGWFIDGSGKTMGYAGYPGSTTTLDLIASGSTFVQGNNNAETVVGFIQDDQGVLTAFIGTKTVSEPAGLIVIGVFAIALGGLARRRA